MKRLTFLIVIVIMIALPLVPQKGDTERELARTQEYIAATVKQGTEKIAALQAYIQKFPDKSQKWTKLAYYSMAVEYFQMKDYANAVKYGKMTLDMGAPGQGEEGRLYLVIGNSYGVKSASIYDKDQALNYTNKAITFASANGLKDVLSEAKKLRGKLTAPPPKKMTPEQQIKKHYADMAYSEAISFYRGLGASDKANPEIHKTYANALFKAKRYDSALKEFTALYEADKKGIFALRIGDIYAERGKKNKKLLDSAVDYYLESGLLYEKEGNKTNAKVAFKKAEYQLFEKYDFNKKVKAFEAKLSKDRASAQKNEAEIRRLKKELRNENRRLRREYQDILPPQYEQNKIKKLEETIARLEAGESADTSDEGDRLEQEKKRIQKEYDQLLAAAKKRLNL